MGATAKLCWMAAFWPKPKGMAFFGRACTAKLMLDSASTLYDCAPWTVLRAGGGSDRLPVGYVIAVISIRYSIQRLAGAVRGCRPRVVIT